ncbi:unnamed protein product [Euphydryas editha]|uniref:Endonuclease/exonuclease/phosphatase domain-containing protein n=1 Tax=Euphydryas editha TaxID=104508 RepID=A0AAU9U388_EUPED|nr:unnamed protein product [Euphydryas editha]
MGERIISYPDFLLYHIGTTPGHYGVGFVIKKHLINCIEGFVGISERISIMNLKLPGYKNSWSIVQVYSPTEQSDLQTIDTFYLELYKAIQEHAHKNLIVMGDYNGQIGERISGENTVLVPFTYSTKTRSRNGEKIVNFALENNLTILNTMYKKNKKKKWTWISPDGKTKNQIDFIMTNRNSCFTNFEVINKLNFNSNHRLIRAELKTTQPRKPRPKRELGNVKLGKYQIEQLAITLRDKFKDYKENIKCLGTQEKYDWIENTIKTETQLAANTKTEQKKWLTSNTIKLLEERNHLINAKDTKHRRKAASKN